MVAVGVLNAAKERELVIRAHVQLERLHPGPFAVINPLAVLPISFAARLPIALEHRAAPVRERCELCMAQRREAETARQRECRNQTPLQSTMLHLCDLRASDVQRCRRVLLGLRAPAAV